MSQPRPNLGEFEDAVILKTFGEVAEDFRSPEDTAQGRTVRHKH